MYEKARKILSCVGAGWNLGNSLDVFRFAEGDPGGETGWGNPMTTRSMLRAVAEMGFGAVRIPVTWKEDLEADGRTIRKEKLERVKEILHDVQESGMYAVINTHHENSWLFQSSECSEALQDRYAGLWKQISSFFRDEPESVFFEAMNEPRVEGGEKEWEGAVPAVREKVNLLQELFVRTVRESGGNNTSRLILLTTAGASPYPDAIRGLVLPEDENIAVSLHIYLPHDFCYSDRTTGYHIWDGSGNGEIARIFEGIRLELTEKGIPVAITEFGASDKDNEEEVIRWAREILREADAQGIPCFWWDNNEIRKEGDRFALYHRNTDIWVRRRLAEALVKGRNLKKCALPDQYK